MSEHLPTPNPEELLEEVDSRFGDKAHFCEILLHNEIKVLGDLADFAEVAEHQNETKFAELKSAIEHNQPKNSVTAYYFGSEAGKPIFGVFKPHDGENPHVQHEYHIDRMDVREVLAYEISEHFGFDLVPPTVHREINGQVGSLQLFIPQESYQTVEWVEKLSRQSHFDFARDSVDWELMAAFDYIIANTDRHARNVLVRYDREGERVSPVETDYGAELVAIDNGTSFSSQGYYDRDVDLKGPNADLTYSLDEAAPLQIEIPGYMKEMLRSGLARRGEFGLERYEGLIEGREILAMWERVENLLKSGVFLSRYNERAVFGY